MTDVRKLDLNLLVVLDALLAEKNLTHAGERIGMTQPAVSSSLTKLRALFDDQLLVRQGRGFVLTPRAEQLVPSVAECVSAVHRTFEVLPTFDPLMSTRTFIVSASDYFLAELTGPLLGLLRREAPHTRLQFSPLPIEEGVTPIDLLRNDVIIAGTGRGVPGKRASLFSDRFVCIIDAAHPALQGERLPFSALGAYPHVRSSFGVGVATHIDDMLSEAGVIPRDIMTVQGFMSVPFALPGTEWLGWVPERTAHRYAADLGLVIAHTPIEPAVLVEAAHWHPSKSSDPALQWLLQQLRVAAELVEFGGEEE